jgi:ComF family protein
MTLINDFLSLIYPRHCEACGNNLFKHEVFICNYCHLNLPKSNYHQVSNNELTRLFAARMPIQNAFALYVFEKSGKIQKLLHAIKYQHQKELALHLGTLYAAELAEQKNLEDVDVILPIPLHERKLKLRGFNQSEWFAKGLAQGLGKPLEVNFLTRLIDTKTQTKKKKYARWENVEGVFGLNRSGDLIHKHILLVDDVITTGATIEAAWQAMKDVEGIQISVISIAFANQNRL